MGDFEERLSYLVDLNRLVGRIRVDLAPRGFGKTSLLRQYQRRAKERGALTIWVTAGEQSGLIGQILAAIRQETVTWQSEKRTRLVSMLDSVTIGVGVPGIARAEVSAKRPLAAAGSAGVREFENVIRTTTEAGNAAGVVIFIDEIQAADAAGLRTLAYAWQHLQAEGADVPAAIFAAGLPDAPDKISAVVTFAERIAYRPLGRLSADAEEIAISAPARAVGVTWQADALAAAISVAGGYPYSVQLIADSSWAAAGRPDPGGAIALVDVQKGQEAMRGDLDALFRARWANAAPQERDVMTAMAQLGDDPVNRADIAVRMGVTASSLSVPRARLIDKGLVQSEGRGLLGFTIPGFASFIRELDQ
ncbi:ATP-binding protein [Subtercola endophyticus]|uniref:ATP-binding protein n=1 Tax=Subtercola endophyticus TaxID=2895559 RepID=UPI001E602A11|nr:ATP-binding protein [Subtercola endophyticus]UFS58169.1 ATP-binding protein [Subtercola endophyticus]